MKWKFTMLMLLILSGFSLLTYEGKAPLLASEVQNKVLLSTL